MRYRFFNKINICIMLIIIVVIGISFSVYMHQHYPKEGFEIYEEVEKTCRKEQTAPICNEYRIRTYDDYVEFMKHDMREKRKNLNQTILALEITQHEMFSYVSHILPLLISIIVVYTITSDLKNGFYKQILLRTKYKNYLLYKLKSLLIASNIYPLMILLVHFIAGVLTNFNMKILPDDYGIGAYSAFADNHYFLYLVTIYITSYCSCFIYGLISLICSVKEKSSISAVIKSFIACLLVAFLDFYFLNLLCGKILKIKNIDVNTFSILDYPKLNAMNPIGVTINVILLLFIIIAYGLAKYYRKEKLYEAVERETSDI